MVESKPCTSCGLDLPLSSYRYKKGGLKLKHSFCKVCEAVKQKAYREKKKLDNYEAYNIDRQRYALKANYGLTLEEYWEMWDKQDGLCKICKNICSKNLAVDHCHKTNKVRGLLCGKCNKGLGLFRDSTEFLASAIEYLKENENGYT